MNNFNIVIYINKPIDELIVSNLCTYLFRIQLQHVIGNDFIIDAAWLTKNKTERIYVYIEIVEIRTATCSFTILII